MASELARMNSDQEVPGSIRVRTTDRFFLQRFCRRCGQWHPLVTYRNRRGERRTMMLDVPIGGGIYDVDDKGFEYRQWCEGDM